MNVFHRITEVRNHIDKLQETANKHRLNGKKRRFNLVCQTIKENKVYLQQLTAEQINYNKLTQRRINHE